MADTSANINLEGNAVVEVELLMPNNKIIAFNEINTTHVRSKISESIKGINEHELVVRSPTTDFIDSLVRFDQSQGTPLLRFRLGVGTPGKMTYLPWHTHIIVDFNAAIEGVGKTAGHFCRITTRSKLFTMSRQTKVKARSGYISDIVQEIATENGFTDMVIEPTLSQGTWIQNFIDDYDFVRSRMVPRAVNAKGRGSYSFYTQDGVLHFHSPDYQAALKTYDYFSPNDISLCQMDDSQRQIEAGASGVRVVNYNPLTGQTAEIASDVAKALRFGNTVNLLSNLTGTELNISHHQSASSPNDPQNMAQSTYENAHSQALGVRLELNRNILIRVGDILNLTISPSGGKASPWSGTYLVTNSYWGVDSGALVSAFVIKRGEFQTSNLANSTASVFGENVIESEQQAPGQPLNLKSTQSSPLTHGAGQSSDTSVFATTQSPNAAPNPTPNY